MAVTLTVNGSGYSFPNTGDENWGSNVTNWATAVTVGMLQKAGGTFTLTADVDFGASFGLKAAYFKSRSSNIASTGIGRFANNEGIAWRDFANGANLVLKVNASDELEYNGNPLLITPGGVLVVSDGGTGISSYAAGDLLYASGTTTLAKLTIGAASTVLTRSGSSLPAWALLVDANIDAAAAIERSKIAAGTNDHVVINSGAGALSSEAALSAVRGGTGVANNVAATLTRSGNHALTLTTTNTTGVTLPTTGTLATLAGAETLTNKTMSGASSTFTAIPIASQSSGAAVSGALPRADGAGAISFSRFPVAAAYQSGNTTVAGNGTFSDIIGNTEIVDTDSAYDTGTGVFTVPVGQGGVYEISATATLQVTASFNGTSENWTATVDINTGGSEVNLFLFIPASGAYNVIVHGMQLVSLSAGDVVKVKVAQNSGANANLVGNVATRIGFRRVQ